MIKLPIRIVINLIAAAGLMAVASRGAMWAASDAPQAEAKVSSYAPAADLTSQLTAIAARLDELLSKSEDFDDARKSRIAKEADVAVVVCLGLALSDEEHPLRQSAASALSAAQAIAKAEDYNVAKQSLGRLKDAIKGKPAPAVAKGHVHWEPVAPLGLLMKEVPIINSSLKRAVQGERFKTQTKVSAAAAATLAVIALESASDHDALKNPADAPRWEQFCAEMRDAAGSVNRAIHAGDAESAAHAMTRLSQSCEHCHRAFRK
jgi:hypothetical protein